MINPEKVKNILAYGKTARGKTELLRHLEDQKITLRQAVNAHCYDCMGYYADGKVDCNIPTCPLHPFMYYNEKRLKRTMKN